MTQMVPNSYQKPNLYTDRLMRFLTGDEWKTLDYALRRTFGWNRERDRISVSQFMNGNGRLGEDGYPVEYGTGLNRTAQIEALNELMRFGILVEAAPNNAAKQGRLWELQLDESQVRFDLLRERYETQQNANRRKTAKARQAAMESREGIGLTDRPMGSVCGTDQHRSVGQTSTGLTDRPILVCGTDPQKPSEKPRGKTGETHPEEGAVAGWRGLVATCGGDETAALAIWKLQERFAAVTKLKRPDPATVEGRAVLARDWWPNLKLTLEQADGDPEAAEAALAEAFARMVQRPQPLNVSSPRSVVNVAASVLAGKRRGAPPAALGQRPKGMAGIDAYAVRRGLPNGN